MSGKFSRNKGATFEREIAEQLRQIYDHPVLLGQIAEAKAARDLKRVRRLQKASRVRRSDQGKGAKEPDVVIRDGPVWLELQHAAGKAYRPEAKYAQAVKDVAQTGVTLFPVALCKKTGSGRVEACCRLDAVLGLLDCALPSDAAEVAAGLVVRFESAGLFELLRFFESLRRADDAASSGS